MLLNKEDVWADLRYALDELGGVPRDKHSSLIDTAYLYEQHDDEVVNRLLQIGVPSLAYSRARSRSDTRNAHEAIEKGLKAILIDGGLPEKQVRSRGHELHRLLLDVQQHNPAIFDELERCFDSTIQYLEIVTSLQHNTNILDYFQKHGKSEIFVANRYASIEGGKDTQWGMIVFIYIEIIRAILSLIFGCTPKDINHRIEKEASMTILAESKRDPTWDAVEWLSKGPVRPRLEVNENLTKNKVLRGALRRCARESKDSGIQYWAGSLRRKYVAARRKARAAHPVV
ncbi:MAG: hypothetical protein OXQ89_22565 [Rhodospirillaceae bacterium]|nr:hypothetical protein [Rhodospirillaceae bacterium]